MVQLAESKQETIGDVKGNNNNHFDDFDDLCDYVSSCGIPLMPAVYQVVGFGRGDSRHSGRQGRSVV